MRNSAARQSRKHKEGAPKTPPESYYYVFETIAEFYRPAGTITTLKLQCKRPIDSYETEYFVKSGSNRESSKNCT